MKENIKELLYKNIYEASGCTEPIAIAYAAALAGRNLEDTPASASIILSPNIIKNALIVCLPGTDGRYGIRLAAGLGLLYGNPEAGLNVISGIGREQIEAAVIFSEEVEVRGYEEPSFFYIEVSVTGINGKSAKVRIEGNHTNVVFIEKDGKSVYEAPPPSDTEAVKKIIETDITLKDIWEFAAEYEDDEFLDKIIAVNSAVMEEGFLGDYGLGIGKTVKDCCEGDSRSDVLLKNINYIISGTSAGVDARMAGADLPVMVNSGSGNQGLVSTLPVIVAAELLDSSREKLRRAVLLSSLVTIYIKSTHNVLSAFCGAVFASSGVAAALTYLSGGDFEKVKNSINNNLGNTFGIVCDGAKGTCSLKVADCVFSAVYSSFLAMKNRNLKRNEGIVRKDAEETIINISRISAETSACLDKTLINIMLEKK